MTMSGTTFQLKFITGSYYAQGYNLFPVFFLFQKSRIVLYSRKYARQNINSRVVY